MSKRPYRQGSKPLAASLTSAAVAAALSFSSAPSVATDGPAYNPPDPTTGAMMSVWSDVSDPGIWTRAWNNRFKNQMPNALDPNLLGVGFIYRGDIDPQTNLPSNTYTIHAGQTDWDILGIGVKTKVWGYGNYETGQVTFPGRTLVVQRGTPIKVNWENNLVGTDGVTPLPHLLPIDQTIMEEAFGIDGSKAINGVPIAIHHHGGDTAFEFDGGPDQWFVPKRQQIGPGVYDTPSYDPVTGTLIHDKNTDAVSEQLNYTYDNNQEASMHWYHDHGEGVTRINAYAGLAGLYVVRDANEKVLTDLTAVPAGTIAKNKIPSGPYEVPLVIQDRAFAADGSMSYGADPGFYPIPLPTVNPNGAATAELPSPGWEGIGNSALVGTDNPIAPFGYWVDRSNPTHFPEMFADVINVNGVAWPQLKVEPREYRLRLLNGSDSRVYNLSFGGLQFWQVGTDLGFLNKPVPLRSVVIAPGERIDVVVNFADSQTRTIAGKKVRQIVVTNNAATPYPFGAPVTVGPNTIMQFDVSLPLNAAVPRTKLDSAANLRGLAPVGTLPALQTPRLAAATVPAGTKVRRILLGEGADQYGRITPLMGTYDPADPYVPGDLAGPSTNKGTQLFHDQATETVTLKRDAAGQPLPTTEVWEFWNATVDSHPIHMHLVQFRVLNRQGFIPSGAANDPVLGPLQVEATTQSNGWSGIRLIPAWNQLVTNALQATPANPVLTPAPAGEQGWKDTVLAPPGQVTRVLATFTRPGKYVYHCHILSHEERDMMRWFEVK
jgi:spore coat protein A